MEGSRLATPREEGALLITALDGLLQASDEPTMRDLAKDVSAADELMAASIDGIGRRFRKKRMSETE